MKVIDHASFSTIRKFVRDVLGEKVSRGYLRKVVAKTSAALDAPYAELLDRLPLEQALNVDETGHKYMIDFNITVQFCIAHLIRDIKFLTGLPDAETRAYGQRLLAAVKAMFKVIHQRGETDPLAFHHRV
jgi:hypothetical protein